MLNCTKRLAPWAIGVAAVLAFTGCSSNSNPSPAPIQSGAVQTQPGPSEPDAPQDPGAPGDSEPSQEFTGNPSTETITANQMDIEIPTGLKIPEDSLVTQASPTTIMIADADEGPVVAMVEQSAADAGYEVYAEVPGGTVYVGHGNAVLFTHAPNAQIITWGPEVMKDVLASG